MNSFCKVSINLGLAGLLGISVFACAMPGEEEGVDDPSEQTEETETASSELRIGGGGTSSGGSSCTDTTSCKSDDGNQSCSCKSGERCVKTVQRCWCEAATRLCGGGGGGGVIMH